jgi:type II secretion system protein G
MSQLKVRKDGSNMSTNQHTGPLKIRDAGFTIVELLIVIVVIGVLATLVINSFSGAQVKARDADRINDVAAIKKALERYYSENGTYPNSDQVKDITFRKNTLKLADDATRTPNSSNLLTYCWSATPSQYCYVAGGRPNPPGGDCTGGTDPSETCKWYTISYRLEKDPGTMLNVPSLNRE